MLRRFGPNFVVLSILLDTTVVWLTLYLLETLRPSLQWLPFSQPVGIVDHVPDILRGVISLLWIGVFFLHSLYDPRRVFRAIDELRILLQGTFLAGLASSGLVYLTYRDVSRWTFVLFVLIALALLTGWRITARTGMIVLRRPSLPEHRAVVVGSGPIAEHVSGLVGAHHWTGLKLVGYVAAENGGAGSWLGAPTALRTIVGSHRVDEILVVPPYSDAQVDEMVGSLWDLPVHIRVVPRLCGLGLDRSAMEDFAGVPLIDLRAGPLTDYERVLKRAFDLAVGAALVIVTLPLLGSIALAIRLFGRAGPVVFRQYRVGENGRLFLMYKFRTMIDGADTLQPHQRVDGARGPVIHKQPDDPRVTRVGRFLRRTSLDELPQLINVLKGDMSLVGPRPELPWLVEQYAPWQRRRLVVPQGITGWWQVSGRADRLMHLNTDVDLYYISHYSFWLDVKIFWRTLGVVLKRTGAY